MNIQLDRLDRLTRRQASDLLSEFSPRGGKDPLAQLSPQEQRAILRAIKAVQKADEETPGPWPQWAEDRLERVEKAAAPFTDLVKAARAKKGKDKKKPGKAQALHGAMDRLPEGTKIEASGGSYQKQGKGWQDHQGQDVSGADAMGKLQEEHGDDHLWDSLKDHAGGDSTTWAIPPAPGKKGEQSAAEKKVKALNEKLQAKRRELEAHKQARIHEAELKLVEKQLAAHKGAK